MEQPQRDTGLGKFTRILGMVMAFVYMALGIAFFTKVITIGIDETYTMILGAGLVIYGAFRFYRAFRGNPGIKP